MHLLFISKHNAQLSPPKKLLSSTSNLFSSVPERSNVNGNGDVPSNEDVLLSQTVKRVAVAGATGRTGKFVVQQLLAENVPVLAMVRDVEKAGKMFPANELLTIRETDLGSKEDVIKALNEGIKCDAAIWAATGFSDSPDQSFIAQVSALFGFATNAKKSIDAIGLPALGEGLAKSPKRNLTNGSDKSQPLPKVVMLSSAGVTRPDWSEEKKKDLEGCSDIPIVRLNPFGILGIKKASEEQLRNCGAEYTIFRPCGLNDKWPSNQRPIFSQFDVAVGRINREDVAKILVSILTTPEATGKTFEAASVANSEGYYPPAESIGPALGRLQLDSDGVSEEGARATYALMQQLLPGEKQKANKLAMGQTYEQLDQDKTGRLGERGEEQLDQVPMKPSS